MAAKAYRMVGPDPQATHFLCDTEAELPTADIHAGDTAYAKDTGRLFKRGSAAWIESMPAGHAHVVNDVGGLQTALDGKTAVGHTHGQADVAGLVTALNGKADAASIDAALAARPAHVFKRTSQHYDSIVTALSDVGDLSVPVAADTDYSFELVLFYQTVAVGTGLSLSLNGPAAPAGRSPVWESAIQTTGGPSTTALSVKAQTAANALHTTASVDLANTPRIARYFGFWPVGSVAGTLVPRFASEVATSQVRLLRGSWFKVY